MTKSPLDYLPNMSTVIAVLIMMGIVLAVMALPALIFMLVWNAVMPKFWAAAPHLNFWYAWGVLFLLGCLRGRASATVENKR